MSRIERTAPPRNSSTNILSLRLLVVDKRDGVPPISELSCRAVSHQLGSTTEPGQRYGNGEGENGISGPIPLAKDHRGQAQSGQRQREESRDQATGRRRPSA